MKERRYTGHDRRQWRGQRLGILCVSNIKCGTFNKYGDPNSIRIECLMGSYPKRRFFPNCYFMELDMGDHAAWEWKSLLVGGHVLKWEGLWSFGNGLSIRIFNNLWIHTLRGFRTLSKSDNDFMVDSTIDSLINCEDKKWDISELRRLFS